MAEARRASALTIAGSDSGGGAGIQADLKTFAAHRVHGLSAIAALTAQHTRGVTAVHVPAIAFLRAQVDACFDDFDVRRGQARHAGDGGGDPCRRRRCCERIAGVPVVLDPVMVATSRREVARRRRPRCVAHAPAAAGHDRHAEPAGSGIAARCMRIADRRRDARGLRSALRERGAQRGAAEGRTSRTSGGDVVDLLADARGLHEIIHPRLALEAHGTGCTLASAIAAQLALGDDAARRLHRRLRLRASRACVRLSPRPQRCPRARSLRRRADDQCGSLERARRRERRPSLRVAGAHSDPAAARACCGSAAWASPRAITCRSPRRWRRAASRCSCTIGAASAAAACARRARDWGYRELLMLGPARQRGRGRTRAARRAAHPRRPQPRRPARVLRAGLAPGCANTCGWSPAARRTGARSRRARAGGCRWPTACSTASRRVRQVAGPAHRLRRRGSARRDRATGRAAGSPVAMPRPDLEVDLEVALGRVAVPIRAVRMAHDWLAPASSLRRLLAKMPRRAARDRRARCGRAAACAPITTLDEAPGRDRWRRCWR